MKRPAIRRAPLEHHRVAALARQYSQEAIETLAEIMSDNSEKSSDRLKAIEILLARGYGAPREVEVPVDTRGKVPLSKLSNEQLSLLAAMDRVNDAASSIRH